MWAEVVAGRRRTGADDPAYLTSRRWRRRMASLKHSCPCSTWTRT